MQNFIFSFSILSKSYALLWFSWCRHSSACILQKSFNFGAGFKIRRAFVMFYYAHWSNDLGASYFRSVHLLTITITFDLYVQWSVFTFGLHILWVSEVQKVILLTSTMNLTHWPRVMHVGGIMLLKHLFDCETVILQYLSLYINSLIAYGILTI